MAARDPCFVTRVDGSGTFDEFLLNGKRKLGRTVWKHHMEVTPCQLVVDGVVFCEWHGFSDEPQIVWPPKFVRAVANDSEDFSHSEDGLE